MSVIIIFTRIDGFTRPYFQNFFGEIQNENDFILQVENLVFVSDTKGNPEIFQLAPILNKFKEDNTFYVLYHETSPVLNTQKEFIEENILNEIEFDYEDHHNDDGLHFQYILNAAEYYKCRQMEQYNNQIDLLIQAIKNKYHGN